MTQNIELNPSDPTIFAVCLVCNRRGLGVPLGDINCKAYTRRDWHRDSSCENCDSQMLKIYEVTNE